MAFYNSRFRLIRIVLMTLAVPAAIMSWGHNKVLGWQNLAVQGKKAISTNRENSLSPDSQQGLYFRNVGKVPNLLLNESTFLNDSSRSIRDLPKLPDLRKSVINELPELLSKSDEIRKLTSDSLLERPFSSLGQAFVATAYSLKGKTACGVPVGVGVVAADTKVLPLGSIVKIEAGKYSGLYRVLDKGSAVRGNHIDIYMPCRSEARLFGRRKIQVEVVRYGWGNSNKIDELSIGQ
ncbi:MAG: 3D domain-containing protein [Acidobacteria bacterium]|nr:3D domain-containing protein [Acidobacteriota bacterium]